MKVYFDTNVFDHIFKKINLSNENLNSLYGAKEASKFSILLSTLNIEEMISMIKSSNEYPAKEMELLLNLTDWENGFVKLYDEIIKEDIDFFLKLINKKEYMYPSTVIHSNYQFLLKPNFTDQNEIMEIVLKTQKQKEEFHRQSVDFKNNTGRLIKGIKGHYPSFEEFKRPHINKFTLEIFNQIGQFSQNEIDFNDKILDIKSIRLYTETTLSLIYSNLFIKRSPKIGDSRDLLHTILATPADIFITNDKSFLNILKRVTVENIQFQNLKEFINEYC